MHPILVKYGPITIYSFGVALFTSVLLASFLIWKLARKRGLPEEKVFDTLLGAIFIGLISGRLGYVFQNWQVFSVDWARIFFVNHYAGLSFAWALFGGLIMAIFIAWSSGLEVLLILDYFAIAFSWSFIVGLGGCFLDGCLTVQGFKLPWLIAGNIVLALVLIVFRRKVDKSPELAALARRHGIFISTYLIFFLGSLLIVLVGTRESEAVLYLVLLFIAMGFFLWRYHKIFYMVKFPAKVLSQIKAYLEAKGKDAENRLKELKKEDPFVSDDRLLDRSSDDSEATAKAGHERVTALQQQMNMVLVQTRKALTKIKIGKYGICESCGKMIDTDRLAAMPTATFCVACAKRKEK